MMKCSVLVKRISKIWIALMNLRLWIYPPLNPIRKGGDFYRHCENMRFCKKGRFVAIQKNTKKDNYETRGIYL